MSNISNRDHESLQVISQISAISSHNPTKGSSPANQFHRPVKSSVSSYAGQFTPSKLDHHIFSTGEWWRAKYLEHPSMHLTLSVRKNDYKALSFKRPNVGNVSIQVKLDTCAQSCLWSLK